MVPRQRSLWFSPVWHSAGGHVAQVGNRLGFTQTHECLSYTSIYRGYNNFMEITFDPAKNARNVTERGLSFDEVKKFDFQTAKFWQDTRHTYPEPRFVAPGYLKARLHVLVFSETAQGIRVISFRKANLREGAKHGFTLTQN
jgi:uncharacterized protein